MTNLDQILIDRECRYGSFIDVAQRTNNIFASILNGAPQFPSTTPLYREALHMISYKLARLANGRINDRDSWQDIAGYAMLVHNQIRLEEEAKAAESAAKRAAPPKGTPLSDEEILEGLSDMIVSGLTTKGG